MDFGEVLGRAWRIVWRHKILWIFGIFAGCARGGAGGGGGAGGRGGVPTGPGAFREVQQFAIEAVNWIEKNPWVIALFVLVVLLLIVIFLWLGTMGRIGLIRGTYKADKAAERLGFGELWNESTPFFWRILWLTLIVVVLTVILVLPPVLFGMATAGLGLLCILPLICILILVLFAVGLVLQMVEPAIVLENLSMADGVRRGWEVFRRHVGPILVIWLILLVIAIAAGLVIALPLLIVLIPAFFAFFASSSQSGNFSFTPLIVAGLCFVAYLPVLLVLNGIRMAYLQSVWTLTYMRLTQPKPAAEAPVVQAPNA